MNLHIVFVDRDSLPVPVPSCAFPHRFTAYPATSRDWLESKRYVIRVDARPQSGSVSVCVPLPAAGDYAIAVHHDVNGNRKSDLSDGAGMSNNPGIRKILGLVPRPPSVDKVRFAVGEGVTRMSISMQYM